MLGIPRRRNPVQRLNRWIFNIYTHFLLSGNEWVVPEYYPLTSQQSCNLQSYNSIGILKGSAVTVYLRIHRRTGADRLPDRAGRPKAAATECSLSSHHSFSSLFDFSIRMRIEKSKSDENEWCDERLHSVAAAFGRPARSGSRSAPVLRWIRR